MIEILREQATTLTTTLTDYLEVICCSDLINGVPIDTKVTIPGHFWIAGPDREAFITELRHLIDRYEI